jgi:hypothetical protein
MTASLHRLVFALATMTGLFLVASAEAAPLWSRIDTGTGATVAANGQIAQAGTYADSVWVRVLNPDGAIRWTANWNLKTIHSVHVGALIPTSSAGWILAVDTGNSVGSWIVRLDSLGQVVGSPMGMRHDTGLTLYVVDAAGETWAMNQATSGRPPYLYRFDSSGRFKDSTQLNIWGTTQALRFVSGKLVSWSTQSSAHLEYFQLFGVSTHSTKDSVVNLDYDSLRESYYSSVWRDGSGLASAGGMVFAMDSGKIDYAKGLVPRVRVVSWVVRGDSLVRQIDATNDLAYFNAFWSGKDGNLIVVGSRRTAASLGGIPKFEPAVAHLDAQGKALRITAVHPNGSATTDLANVFARSFPEGSGFVGVTGSQVPTWITVLDRNGDSTRSLSLSTIHSVNAWFGQPGETIVNLGESDDGGTRSIESWSTAATTSLRNSYPTFSSLRAVGGRLILDLDHPVALVRIDLVDLQGRVLETRSMGALTAGRHAWDISTPHPALVHLRLDDETLVAKVPARMR